MLYTYSLLGRNGRLGNQLFQIAGTVGRAHRTGDVTRARFPEWTYREYFSVPDIHFGSIEPGVRSIDMGRAYMQELYEFEHCSETIREYLTPSQVASNLADVIVGPTDGNYLALHVRRGDYLGLAHNHPPPKRNYFLSAVTMIREQVPPEQVIVFSDDPAWCREHLKIPDLRIHEPSLNHSIIENEVADFVAMSRCGAHVISNSTFSWWAAWLADSTAVCYPDPWFGPGLKHLVPLKFIPRHWTSVDARPAGPMRCPGLVVDESPDGFVVTDPATSRVHVLNPAASLVFEFCSGDLSMSEIQETLNSLGATIGVSESITELRRLGLVSNVPASCDSKTDR